jgi:hypothetical protein
MTWNPLTVLYDIQRTVHALNAKVDHMSDQQAEIAATGQIAPPAA